MTIPLTLYVDPAWRREGAAHTPLLYPFWGNALSDNTPFHKALFERYSLDVSLYGITDDASQADMVLMPYSHNVALAKFPGLIDECAVRASALGKLLLIDGVGDIEHSVSVPHAVVLRYGGYRFKGDPREIHVPPYADDLLERYCNGELSVRGKGQTPVVGFAGWASSTPWQFAKTYIKELPMRLYACADTRYRACKKGIFFRRRVLSLVRASKDVSANIIERQSYSGHRETAVDVPEELRREFVENLLGSDYCLDVRGDANASTRLFEILSMGRIPVIIDTERNFPFSDYIDYRTFSLVVDFRELDALPERVVQFHAQVSPERFREMQRAAREAYTKYFRVDSLMTHLVPELRKRMHSHD